MIFVLKFSLCSYQMSSLPMFPFENALQAFSAVNEVNARFSATKRRTTGGSRAENDVYSGALQARTDGQTENPSTRSYRGIFAA
jgi:hypothetical protein